MKIENLESANKLANEIKRIEKEQLDLKQASRLYGGITFRSESENGSAYYPEVSGRFFNFGVMKALALEEMNKELDELKKQFEAL